MKSPLFLALDLGTSTFKIGLFDAQGNLLAISKKESPLSSYGPRVELDPEESWVRVVDGIREVLSLDTTISRRVVSLSISNQGQTFLPVGRDGRPLDRAIVWLDQRAITEREEIRERIGCERLYYAAGLATPMAGYIACNLLWLHRHEPGLFQESWRFLHIGDYILYKLTNQCVAEESIYSCTGLYDHGSGTWWQTMLDLLELDAKKLPELVPSGASLGPITSSASRVTGLHPGTVAVSGTLDVAATALGSNAWTEERVALSLGTTMQTNVTVHEFPQWSSRYPLWIFSHVVPRAYIAVVWHATAGFTLRWFRDTFCELEVQDAQATGQDVYDILTRLAESAPPGSEGLLVLPHLQGTQLPDLQPGFRGVFFGISPSHTKGHFIRAILEGVAYALRENLEIFEKMGITCRELWATGGGTKSTLWNQINADVTGRPQYLLKCNEASSLGAAILAASGSGIYGNILEACTQMVQSAEVIYPNPENFDVYEKGYRLYKDLFQETKTLFISDK